MDKKSRVHHLMLMLLCATVLAFIAPSCSTSKSNTKKKTSYSKQRTRQPRWNATTSQTTTYYIKKKAPRKRYNP